MDATAHRDHLRTEAAAFAGTARLGLDAPVPSCPKWTVGELVEHLGRVLRWVVRHLDEPSAERVEWVAAGDPDPGDDLVGWYDERIAELLQRIDTSGPDAVVSTFLGPQPVSWWTRRQAHETAVHRWDAENAHGAARPIDAALASDGIDEYLGMRGRRKGALDHVGGTIHLHCTDVDGEWFLSFDQGTASVERQHRKGDVAARGPASDLQLLVWGRLPISGVDVIGDQAVLDRWLHGVAPQ
ncbi:MAG: maleylpyruvate isomerase family mycothiol-dependent enzyme [Acidimicrobiales bacterium]